jgi:uncharacterized membrane protein
MKKITATILILILLSLAIATYSYQKIETEKIASHWNAQGEVDGYMSKFWGTFLFPLIIIAVYLIFLAIPKIDPLKTNIEKFRKHYNTFFLVLILFLLYVFILTILANLNYNLNMTMTIIPAIGILFFYIGTIMKKLKRNWFIGIRTPWTLSDDKVWQKTHALGATLFKIIGVILILTTFAPPKYLIYLILIPTIGSVIWLVIYSYLEYKKIKKS